MFADTLFAAERLHLVRLLGWGGASVVAGTLLLLLTASARLRPQLLRAFAMQCVIWGSLELAIAAARFATLGMRDVSGAARLERLGWMQVGLYIGMALCGVAVAVTGWRVAKSLRATGAGLGILLHGVALLVFELFFVGQVSR